MSTSEQTKTAAIDVERAVALTDNLVSQHTGRHLSSIQIAVFREAWLGSRKTYGQLAQETQYSESYVQQGIGPKLWRLLSEITGEKVTKRTVKVTLSQYFLANTAKTNTSTNASDIGASDAIKKQPKNAPNLSTQNLSARNLSAHCENVAASLTFPEDSVPLQSPFYIERGKQECRCYQEVNNPGCLIRIKAPRQMGKSSLVNRILDNAQTSGSKTALLHFQQAEVAVLSDINRLLRWICANLSMQLGFPADLDEYWDDDLGSKMSCNLFLQSHILSRIETPLVVAFEEVNELLEYPQVAREFLTLIRFWHERSKTDQAWSSLRLIMVHSTEIYVSLDVNQSPLNVGLSVSLSPFDMDQIRVLAERHKLALSEPEITQLHQLVGGHPYLTRLAFYHLAKNDLTLLELLQTAATDVSIYHAHLHKYLSNLAQAPSLKETFSQILASPTSIEVNQIDGFKLQSLGLIQLNSEGAVVSCALYEQYFKDRL